MKLQNANIALIYDRVNTPFGGAEQVLLALHELFPKAPLFTSVYDPDRAKWAKVFDVRSSFLQHIPFAKNHHREFVQLMPMAFERFNLDQFDLVISISSAEAKGVLTSPKQLHICYVLTPTRYLWSHVHEYTKGWLGFFKSFAFSRLRSWDFVAAHRPDVMFAISQVVTDRIQKYYHRKVEHIIYPPFTPLPKIQSEKKTQPYFLIVSRLVQYKNIETAIKVCGKEGWNLKIVGEGPEEINLKKLADQQKTNSIEFVGNVTRQTLAQLLTESTAFLLPNEEDFGIAALEALSVGTPVITLRTSGVAELIKDGKTGILLNKISQLNVREALSQAMKKRWATKSIATSVMEYNKKSFQKKFLKAVEKAWNEHQRTKSNN